MKKMRRNQIGNLIRSLGIALGVIGAENVEPSNPTSWILTIVGVGLYVAGFFEKGKE